ncbi:hypothetical protein Tco_1156693 [Tanacetum coccineum]
MVDSQPIEEEIRGAETRDVGMKTHGGPTEPVLQAQKTPSPSPAFIKENIDVLRTMIKEHDQQANIKATPKRFAYADSDKKAPAKSLAKNKDPAHLRRSRRLEDRSITKEKARRERSNPRGKCFGHQETSSDFEHEEGSEDAYEGLNSPYKRPKPTPFTQIITHFKYHRRAKLPRNIRVYEGNKDLEDHLVSQKFLEEFSQQKRYDKDPTEIHGIKRRQNEGLQAFMDRFKSKSSHIKGVPLVLRISDFMHGHGHPELAKKFNDKIPKTVDEMFERVKAFIRGEVVAGFCDYHGDRGHNTNDCYQLKEKIEEVVASGKLAHQVKDIRQNNQQSGSQGRNNVKVINMIREGGNRKRPFEEERSDLTDELTFLAIHRNQLTDEAIILEGVIKGETYHPLGIIDLRVTIGKAGRNKTVLMEFVIIKRRSPYNVIIGRTGMRSLEAVGSTIHSMIKFLTNQGIVTMETSIEALWECRHLERVQGSWKEVQWRQHEEQMSRIREQVIPRTKSSSGQGPNSGPVPLVITWGRENTEEIFIISHERPNQYITKGPR